jgi:copper chaperone CopZ
MSTTTQLFSVPKMHCSSCVMLLEGLEDEIEGIEKVEANFKKQEMKVEFDAEKLSIRQIIEAAKKEGYEATPLSAINLTHR